MIEFLNWAIPILIAVTLLITLVAKIKAEFDDDNGVRSLSAAALPVLCVVLYFVINGQAPLWLTSSLLAAIGVPLAIGFFVALILHRAPLGKVPLAELLVSAILSWLVLSFLSPGYMEAQSNLAMDSLAVSAPFVYSTSGLIGATLYFVLLGWKK